MTGGFPLTGSALSRAQPKQSQRARRRAEWDARERGWPATIPNVRNPAAAPPSAPALWVGDLGVCDTCDQLTTRGHCPSCDAERRREHMVDRVRLRPAGLVARGETEGWTGPDDVAVLRVPDSASQAARHVAREVATIATGRLHSGDTLDFALHKVAAGRDQIARNLAHGLDAIAFDRKTVARALDELVDLGVLDRVGQLDQWWDIENSPSPMQKVGCYIYALNVTCRKLGERALDAVRKAASRHAGRSGPLHAAVRVTGHGRRLDGCLKAAIALAQVGQRNALGHWLACRCTDAGLSEGEAMKVMRIYVADVDQSPPYTLSEAQRTVRSRYKANDRRHR